MVRRTKEDAQKTKDSILEAALIVFSIKGYSKTTFDDIAKHIGLTKGAVYWHFKNKLELLIEMISLNAHKNFKEYYSKRITNFVELKDFFMVLSKRVETDAHHRKLLYFVLFQMEWSESLMISVQKSLDGVLNFPLIYVKEALTDMQKNGVITECLDLDKTAMLLMSTWKGLLYQDISQIRKVGSLSELVDYSFEVIIKGLK